MATLLPCIKCADFAMRQAGVSRTALFLVSIMTGIAGVRSTDVDVAISSYIDNAWGTLTRSHQDYAKAAADPKSHPDPDGRWRVYVPANEDLPALTDQLRRQMKSSEF